MTARHVFYILTSPAQGQAPSLSSPRSTADFRRTGDSRPLKCCFTDLEAVSRQSATEGFEQGSLAYLEWSPRTEPSHRGIPPEPNVWLHAIWSTRF